MQFCQAKQALKCYILHTFLLYFIETTKNMVILHTCGSRKPWYDRGYNIFGLRKKWLNYLTRDEKLELIKEQKK